MEPYGFEPAWQAGEVTSLGLLGIVQLIAATPEIRSVLSEWKAHGKEQMVYNLVGSARAILLSALAHSTDTTCLCVTSDWSQAESLAMEVRSYLGPEAALVFPPLEIMPIGMRAASPELGHARLRVLDRVVSGKCSVAVAPVTALMSKTAPLEEFRSRSFRVQKGEDVSPSDLVERLLSGGYKRAPIVEEVGTFSLRGGILDVFPPSRDDPVRFDFIGNIVESIRAFSPDTQRSIADMDEVSVIPAREFNIDPSTCSNVSRRLEHELRIYLEKADLPRRTASFVEETVAPHARDLSEGLLFEGIEQHSSLFYDHLSTLLSYLPDKPLVIVDEPLRLRESARSMEKSVEECFLPMMKEGKAFPWQIRMWSSWSAIFEDLRRMGPIYFSGLARSISGASLQNIVQARVDPALGFAGHRKALVDELNRLRKSGRVTVLLASTPERARHMAEALREEEIPAAYCEAMKIPPPACSVVASVGLVEAGFHWNSGNLAVFTESDIQGRMRKARRTQRSDGTRIRALPELNVGDYVVHASHGIGVYRGVRTLEIDGVQRDYIFLQYAGEDALYVPTDQINHIFKYVGTEGVEPRIYRLGGNEWARVRKKASDSVKEMARELLEVYAVRQTKAGYSFSPDSVWQHEFEDAFGYQETPDQTQAAIDVKRDMETPRPMDRLLCGDVGYGKTEIAVRAAFKAAVDGKQTALLVPTTILAMQHYSTFKGRFAGYPVSVDVLSRFRSQKEQSDIIKRLAQGKIDVIIGTHRLLQDDICFKDLGLLVIDEEHRFGVVHKERLKRIKGVVDVLTLSATPIPRTLHMALGGLRDMSIMETPPEDRYPVQTYVVEHDDDLIRQAIMREIHRGGQVFYVHNRIQTIDRAAERVERMVPQARCVIAHGQMKEEDLEKTMLDFMEHKHDILVCTTIIESGLDIANVNTLIIEDAGNLGLAQLYQLRGRVGRSNRVAHAYLTYRSGHVLTDTAEKRLQAIKEFTELGSGFRIALRDMEIRGAGNILGPEQHGFIVSIGFDMYLHLLKEAVKELKGETKEAPPRATVDIRVDAYVPADYIPDARQKIEVYKRIAEIGRVEEGKGLMLELRDRFGPMPQLVENLIKVAILRLKAGALGVRTITADRWRVTLSWQTVPDLPSDAGKLLGPEFRRRSYFSAGRKRNLVLRTEGLDDREVLAMIDLALERLGYILGVTCGGGQSDTSQDPIRSAGKNE